MSYKLIVIFLLVKHGLIGCIRNSWTSIQTQDKGKEVESKNADNVQKKPFCNPVKTEKIVLNKKNIFFYLSETYAR